MSSQLGAPEQVRTKFKTAPERVFIAIFMPARSSSCRQGPQQEDQRVHVLGWQRRG